MMTDDGKNYFFLTGFTEYFMLTSAQRYIDTRMISHLTVAKQSSNNISADFFVLFKKLFVL
jgi:hypothetical protein